MHIVIDIPEEVKHKVYAYGLSLCPSDKEQLINAIMNGTPLPKGHGRLIDADELRCENADFDTYNDYCTMFDEIDNAPTIIEADKEHDKTRTATHIQLLEIAEQLNEKGKMVHRNIMRLYGRQVRK